MNELRIVRGTDVRLYADETPLFGVTDLTATEKKRYHEVYEYLSSAPCERVPQGSYYELKLIVMTLFDGQLPQDMPFTLRIADGDTVYSYEGCRITERKTELKGSADAYEVFTVEAEHMRKQVASHE